MPMMTSSPLASTSVSTTLTRTDSDTPSTFTSVMSPRNTHAATTTGTPNGSSSAR
ncbi:hypothetical protein D3C75_1381420 [compost metagenome]